MLQGMLHKDIELRPKNSWHQNICHTSLSYERTQLLFDFVVDGILIFKYFSTACPRLSNVQKNLNFILVVLLVWFNKTRKLYWRCPNPYQTQYVQPLQTGNLTCIFWRKRNGQTYLIRQTEIYSFFAFTRIADHRSKITIIRDVVARKEVKVVFFGRTSSGKSSAINALLGNKVLPTGLGYAK